MEYHSPGNIAPDAGAAWLIIKTGGQHTYSNHYFKKTEEYGEFLGQVPAITGAGTI
jgi:hypothetical protein